MSSIELYQKIESLPEAAKSELKKFLESLFLRNKSPKTAKPKRIAGFAKGTFEVLPGFDDPIDEFNSSL